MLPPQAAKSTFIAAARRAAQAAGQDPKSRQARPEPFKKNGNETGSLRVKVMTRVKSLFLAASIVAIIVGSIQFASNIFDFGIFDTNDAKFANSAEPDTANGDIASDSLRVRDIGHSRRRPARLLERAAGCASKCTGRCRCHLISASASDPAKSDTGCASARHGRPYPAAIEFESDRPRITVTIKSAGIEPFILGNCARTKRRRHWLDCARTRRRPPEPPTSTGSPAARRRGTAGRHRRATAAQRGNNG